MMTAAEIKVRISKLVGFNEYTHSEKDRDVAIAQLAEAVLALEGRLAQHFNGGTYDHPDLRGEDR